MYHVCPYCKKRMQRGFIVCDGRRTPSWKSEDEAKEVPLAKFNVVSLLTTYHIETLYCDSCQKIVIDAKSPPAKSALGSVAWGRKWMT